LTLEDVPAYQAQLDGIGIASRPARAFGTTATLKQNVCALRFFYGGTLHQTEVPERIAFALKPRTLPEVLSGEEVTRVMEAVPSLKCRVALSAA
jgi:integrase/recombinase XerD